MAGQISVYSYADEKKILNSSAMGRFATLNQKIKKEKYINNNPWFIQIILDPTKWF